jgi:hypothetical protein
VPEDETEVLIPDLEENKQYEFRVIPQNEAGDGSPSDPSEVCLTKARRGGFYLTILCNV